MASPDQISSREVCYFPEGVVAAVSATKAQQSASQPVLRARTPDPVKQLRSWVIEAAIEGKKIALVTRAEAWMVGFWMHRSRGSWHLPTGLANLRIFSAVFSQ